ncbi:hypothetical protein TWF225_003077 [Orbilia oligospora]|nr:hypothetical protein TWF225_003077 [Orbilia oligospora]KAF3244567.1 hypothetical protein TWF128_009673 [Orbilia oligospora]KAF3264913.1 hypothetical protein TWF217_003068 [Orbilia oligospora]KAF3294574.1 hypothetical protein TWF132_003074 [Orbilia oligospora]
MVVLSRVRSSSTASSAIIFTGGLDGWPANTLVGMKARQPRCGKRNEQREEKVEKVALVGHSLGCPYPVVLPANRSKLAAQSHHHQP